MATDLNAVSDEAYERWIREAGCVSDPDSATEENLVSLFSNTMRELDTETRARQLVDVANMALAMADKILGCQVPVAKCLVLVQH